MAMSLTIASGRDLKNASRPLLADSATSTVAPHSSSMARIISRVSSSSSTTSTVAPSSSMGDRCTVVGGDEGGRYYVAVGAARHAASRTAGGRVAVLGLEGRSAHEINALGIGAGESVEAALGNLQGARPSPTVAAPPAASTPP